MLANQNTQDLDIKPFPIVIVGHVDHGKSTLVGRLLHETGSLPQGKVEEIKAISDARGATFEWSFVLDAFQIERDQGITVDTTRIWFKSKSRDYVFIDAPGHKEFLKNMVTGAASADAAVLVVDVIEGVSEQTRRHAYLLQLLGIERVAVVMNKMDGVNWNEERFNEVADEVRIYLDELGLVIQQIVPISARDGDNLIALSGKGPWYSGLPLVDVLDQLPRPSLPDDQALRLPIQDIYRQGDKRYIVGRIESGRLRIGDQLHFYPGDVSARVVSFEGWNETTPQITATSGQSVAITIDEELFIERGHIAVSNTETQPIRTHALKLRLFWLAERSLKAGETLKLRIGLAQHDVCVESIDRIIDVETLGDNTGDHVARNRIAEITVRSRSRLVVDLYSDNPTTGRGVLIEDYRIVGGVVVVEDAIISGRNLTPVTHSVSQGERAAANGHDGGVLWLTGLSGSGKSTLAIQLERQLFDLGWQVFTLDGDNLRTGLGNDLGFDLDSRTENIRRASEVAKLMSEAGVVVIATFITPMKSDREMARSIIGHNFHEVFVDAGLETCEKRDPKGLYAKARAGEIPEFTGISSPYQPPENADLVLDTAVNSVSKSLEELRVFARQVLPVGTRKLQRAS